MLESSGVLHRYETDLERDELPERLLYCTDGFRDWFGRVLPTLKRDRGTLTPQEQVERQFHDFVLGRPQVYNQGVKSLDPMIDGVWEMKTSDVRIFGWFAARNCFIAVNGALRSDLVPRSRFAPFVAEVKQMRDSLDLDEPKFLTGGAPRDVL